jgi:hypothetical protein
VTQQVKASDKQPASQLATYWQVHEVQRCTPDPGDALRRSGPPTRDPVLRRHRPSSLPSAEEVHRRLHGQSRAFRKVPGAVDAGRLRCARSSTFFGSWDIAAMGHSMVRLPS